MANTYQASILTSESTLLEGEVVAIQAPGSGGYLSLLKDHAALITSLQPGTLTVTDKQQATVEYEIRGGVLEINGNQCTILLDALEETRAPPGRRS